MLASVALGVVTSGCGASGPMAPKPAPRADGTTAHSGGLRIALTATPTRTESGSPVRFTASASERHAAGAVGYRLAYGDGAHAESGPIPLFCIAGAAPAVHRMWSFSHRYSVPGRYRALLGVYVNCTRDRTTAAVTISVTGR
jgi:hypothetical protein